jgi:hypothetical protein
MFGLISVRKVESCDVQAFINQFDSDIWSIRRWTNGANHFSSFGDPLVGVDNRIRCDILSEVSVQIGFVSEAVVILRKEPFEFFKLF